MPKMRNLSASVPDGEKPVNASLAVPNVLSGLPAIDNPDALPSLESGSNYHFAAVCTDKARNLESLKAAGVNDADFYLSIGGEIARSNPLRYFLISAIHLKTAQNDQGDVIFATNDLEKEVSPRGDRLDDHIAALLLVIHNNELFPVKAEFRGARTSCVSGAINAVKAASKPDWVSKSDAHKIAGQFPQPFGRVVATASCRRQIARSTGRTYYAGSCVTRPATIEELQLVNTFFAQPNVEELIAPGRDGYKERVDLLLSKTR